MLIVLDCCDRVVEDAAVADENLLKGAGGVGILATSREPLRAEGEIVYRLPPLEIPPASIDLTANDALTYPAVQLFVERVSSSVGRFELSDADAPVVADICRRLDGIALAIELAAGRVDVFGLVGRGRAIGRPDPLLDAWPTDCAPAAPNSRRDSRLELRRPFGTRTGGPPSAVRVRRKLHARCSAGGGDG